MQFNSDNMKKIFYFALKNSFSR